MRALFFSLALLSVSVIAFAQFTAPVPLSTPVYGPAYGDQGSPVVASDGHDFLVAEVDWRTYPPSIYLYRVTADGRVLDGTGIRVTADYPVIAGLHFIDSAYVLLYSYSTFANGGRTAHTGIAVIGVDGKITDGPRVLFDNGTAASASNGKRIILVSAHEFVAIDSRGNVLARYSSDAPVGAIASNGTTFLTAGFKQNRPVWNESLTALDAEGKPIASSEVDNIASLGSDPFIASDGTGYLVVFTTHVGASSTTQRVDDRAQIQSSIDSTAAFPDQRLVWTGSTYIALVWTDDQTNTGVVSYDRYGSPFAPPKTLGPGTPGAVSWNGSEALLVWTTPRWSAKASSPTSVDIVGAVTDTTGTPKFVIGSIATSANAQRNVAIAASGNVDLAAWVEPTGVYATRVSPAGVPLDGRGITVSLESIEWGYSKNVRVIDDGTGFVVAWGGNRTWSDNTDIGMLTGPLKVRRIAYSGEFISDALTISPCSRTFDLAMGDSPVLFFTPCTNEGLVAQRLSAGVPVGPAVIVSSMSTADDPHPAWNGSEWLVAWSKLTKSGILIYPPAFGGEVYAARLSSSLTLLDTRAIPIAGSDSTDAQRPLVATNGRDFIVAFPSITYGSSPAIWTRIVHPDGSLDNALEAVAESYELKGLVWDGARYGLMYGMKGNLFLTHVGTGDRVSISDGIDATAVAHGGPLRVVYTRVSPEPVYGNVSRAFVRDAIPSRRRAVR